MCLSLERDLQVVGETGDAAAVLPLMDDLHPDVVVMDLIMPAQDGIALTQTLRLQAPQVAVIILSLFDDAQTKTRALQAGARAFIIKRSGVNVLIDAIRRTQVHPL